MPNARGDIEQPPQDAVDALVHRFQTARPDQAARAAAGFTQTWPNHPMGWFVLAMSEQRRGRHAEAVPAFERVLALRGEVAEVLTQMGLSLRRLSRYETAVDAYRRSLAVAPHMAETHSNLAAALLYLQHWTEAEAAARRALALAPQSADARANLGQALRRQGRLADAADILAPAARNASAPGWLRRELLLTLKAAGKLNEALAVMGEARAAGADPGLPVGEAILLHLTACAWDGLETLETTARAVLDDTDHGLAPFAGLLMGLDPSRQRLAAQRMARRHRVAGAGPAKARIKRPGERLRIGYLSCDFQDHATAWLLADMIACHDRDRFEIVAFSYGPEDDGAMRRRLVTAFDRFDDIAALDDAAAAEAVRAAGIDILVDLKGYTQDCRPGIPARRPAPVAVNYLGYPGTMGADYIDYLVGDRVVTPADHQPHYDEALVRLPHCYQPNDRSRPRPAAGPTRASLGLPDNAVVFAAFNNSFKIRPETFADWMAIVGAVETSVLWLLARNADTMANLRRSAEAAGVDPARLVFAPPLELSDHLARHRCADLFLDCQPYGAHTTASDALWMGLPVLTIAGQGFPGRVAASLLTACGLDALIQPDRAAFRAAAIRLGQDPHARAALGREVAATVAHAPLFDTPRYTRDLERAYEAMWDRAAAGLGPAPIDL